MVLESLVTVNRMRRTTVNALDTNLDAISQLCRKACHETDHKLVIASVFTVEGDHLQRTLRL